MVFRPYPVGRSHYVWSSELDMICYTSQDTQLRTYHASHDTEHVHAPHGATRNTSEDLPPVSRPGVSLVSNGMLSITEYLPST